MKRPTTQELKSSLEQLVETYNKAVKTQQDCKNAIIATQAVLKDRELEDGDSNTVTSEIAED